MQLEHASTRQNSGKGAKDPRSPANNPSGSHALIEAMERIEQVIDIETEALRRFKSIDLSEFNNRKAQGLLELTRAVRSLNGTRLGAEVASRLKVLRAKLELNQAALSTHLKAAHEITTIVAETIRDSESDGTYSNATTRKKQPW